MRTLFIVNPAAGSTKKWRRFAAGAWRPGWTVEQTRGRGEAAAIAARGLAEGFERVIAVGGDGTLSEAANGLLEPGPLRDGFALGYFPAGSGCDFSRHFNWARGPQAWRHYLDFGKVSAIDAGRVTWTESGRTCRRYFINIAMAGLPGDIVHAMERSGKPLGGTLSYLASSLAHLFRSQAKTLHLALDGEPERSGKYHLFALANTRTTGGGMRIAPRAVADDGLLDFVAVGDLGRPRLLANFPKIYAGTHLKVPGIEERRLARLAARSDEPVRLNIDGEAIGRLPAQFEVLPRALPILLP